MYDLCVSVCFPSSIQVPLIKKSKEPGEKLFSVACSQSAAANDKSILTIAVPLLEYKIPIGGFLLPHHMFSLG